MKLCLLVSDMDFVLIFYSLSQHIFNSSGCVWVENVFTQLLTFNSHGIATYFQEQKTSNTKDLLQQTAPSAVELQTTNHQEGSEWMKCLRWACSEMNLEVCIQPCQALSETDIFYYFILFIYKYKRPPLSTNAHKIDPPTKKNLCCRLHLFQSSGAVTLRRWAGELSRDWGAQFPRKTSSAVRAAEGERSPAAPQSHSSMSLLLFQGLLLLKHSRARGYQWLNWGSVRRENLFGRNTGAEEDVSDLMDFVPAAAAASVREWSSGTSGKWVNIANYSICLSCQVTLCNFIKV